VQGKKGGEIMTIAELLDYLDGRGIIVTDDYLTEEALNAINKSRADKI
jgi:hypothetical protein